MKKNIVPIICALSLGTSMAFAANTVTRKTETYNNDISHKVGEYGQEHSVQKKTADSQMKGTDADVAVTRKIRDRLTDMDDLSTRAQNVTIVTAGNNVTLRGEVDKQEEITKIMSVAQKMSSGRSVSNQLSVHK